MRFYENAAELVSEVFRDVSEMGMIVKPKSYQNKDIEGQDDFITKEMMMYNYCLTDLPDYDNLFLFEGQKAKDWVLGEYLERVNDDRAINPGTAWKIRKDVWTPFLGDDGKFDYSYNERLNFRHNLEKLIKEARRNPDSRQLWLPIFHPEDVTYVGGRRRIPCSLGYFFMVREGKVNLTYVQRSADVFQHWGNDIALAWLVKDYFAERLGLERGYLYHQIFSLHCYKKDWEKLNEGISKIVK